MSKPKTGESGVEIKIRPFCSPTKTRYRYTDNTSMPPKMRTGASKPTIVAKQRTLVSAKSFAEWERIFNCRKRTLFQKACELDAITKCSIGLCVASPYGGVWYYSSSDAIKVCLAASGLINSDSMQITMSSLSDGVMQENPPNQKPQERWNMPHNAQRSQSSLNTFNPYVYHPLNVLPETFSPRGEHFVIDSNNVVSSKETDDGNLHVPSPKRNVTPPIIGQSETNTSLSMPKSQSHPKESDSNAKVKFLETFGLDSSSSSSSESNSSSSSESSSSSDNEDNDKKITPKKILPIIKAEKVQNTINVANSNNKQLKKKKSRKSTSANIKSTNQNSKSKVNVPKPENKANKKVDSKTKVQIENTSDKNESVSSDKEFDSSLSNIPPHLKRKFELFLQFEGMAKRQRLNSSEDIQVVLDNNKDTTNDSNETSKSSKSVTKEKESDSSSSSESESDNESSSSSSSSSDSSDEDEDDSSSPKLPVIKKNESNVPSLSNHEKVEHDKKNKVIETKIADEGAMSNSNKEATMVKAKPSKKVKKSDIGAIISKIKTQFESKLSPKNIEKYKTCMNFVLEREEQNKGLFIPALLRLDCFKEINDLLITATLSKQKKKQIFHKALNGCKTLSINKAGNTIKRVLPEPKEKQAPGSNNKPNAAKSKQVKTKLIKGKKISRVRTKSMNVLEEQETPNKQQDIEPLLKQQPIQVVLPYTRHTSQDEPKHTFFENPNLNHEDYMNHRVNETRRNAKKVCVNFKKTDRASEPYRNTRLQTESSDSHILNHETEENQSKNFQTKHDEYKGNTPRKPCYNVNHRNSRNYPQENRTFSPKVDSRNGSYCGNGRSNTFSPNKYNEMKNRQPFNNNSMQTTKPRQRGSFDNSNTRIYSPRRARTYSERSANGCDRNKSNNGLY